MSAFIQRLESIEALVDYAPSLDKAKACEVYYPNGDESRFRVIKNMTNDKEVCTVSDRYQVLQHSEAVNLILSGIEASGISGAGVLRNYGNTVVTELYFDNLTIRDHTQDGHINTGIRFTNSFDKSVGFKAEGFMWRQVCSNGMLVNKLLPNAPEMSFKHTGDIIEKITNMTRSFIQGITTMEGSLLEIINEATNQRITFESTDQRLKFIIEQVGSERKAKQFIELENIEVDMTKWDLYNAFTHFASNQPDISYNQYEKIHINAQKILMTNHIELPTTTV